MAFPRDRYAILRLTPEQLSRSELLAGLESWMCLSLLSDEQVAAFCQKYLVCPLPVAIAPAIEKSLAVSASLAESTNLAEPVGAISFTSDFANAPQSCASPPLILPASSVRRPPSGLPIALRSFMAEVSIIWLLILGVFMVVASSGVLAATQWQNFSAIGQYGILFAYTIAFAVASLWTARKENLRLTSRMLQVATLLIVPVNFWMMDGLRVGASFVGVIFSAIASLILTVILLQLLHPRTGLTTTERFRLIVANSIGLSWLHWGWGWAGVPLIATYIGTVGTAILLWKQFYPREDLAVRESGDQESGDQESGDQESGDQESGDQESGDQESGDQESGVSASAVMAARLPAQDSLLPNAVIVLAVLLLIGRAILAAQVPIERLGLALGLCGWVLGWLNRREQILWRWVGAGLLLLGWLVSITAEPPWQAIAISGLSLWLLIDRLQTRPNSPIRIALFLVGLQTYALGWRMVSEGLRQQMIEWVIQLAGDRGMPEVLLGIGVFPYIWLTLGAAAWLRQKALPEANSTRSANQAEVLALILGIGLTLISWVNLLLLSLTLTLSTLTLFLAFRQRRSPLPILYLTHVTALVAVLCWINLLFPNLDELDNARILLAGMAIEWSFSRRAGRWQRSAWHLGLVLAGCSYLLLLTRGLGLAPAYVNLVGLLIPLGLTGLSCSSRFPHRRLAAWLSTAMLIAQLLLLHGLNDGLLSLGAAMVLMLLNTRLLRRRFAAFLTIGFALSFEAVAIAVQAPNWVTGNVLANLLAANIWLLWLLRDGLLRDRRQSSVSEQLVLPELVLPEIYAFAANAWAIIFCGSTLLMLTAVSLFEPTWGITATGLTIAAIAYRIWQQPTNLGFYGMAWGTEILVITLVQLSQDQLSQAGIAEMAIATLGLGLLTQVAGDFWVRRSGLPYYSSWHLIPLGYAGLGWLMGHSSFTATTGFYTLATALIGIGVGRRSPRLKPFAFLSVWVISGAAYELLIYQMLQAKGGNAGDGVLLLAGLSALIAIANRLLSRWLVSYLRLTARELQTIAHLHWAIGSGLATLAVPLSLSTQGAILGFGGVGVLSSYALTMGRGSQADEESTNRTLWTYAGIWEAIAALSYGFYRWLPGAVGWAGAIASLLAVGLYCLPWRKWGWSVRPWQNTAVIFPGLVILLTGWNVTLQNSVPLQNLVPPQSLLITAAFYAWLAQSMHRIRLSYLSLLLLDWALLKYLSQQGWLTLMGLSLILGGSLLYIAQVDPALQNVSARQQRHWMRSIASGLISLTAFYQAEIESGAAAWLMGGLALGLGLGLVFLGMILRVRAFLYMGTAAFMLRIFRLLWLFITAYSALLWAIGILLGLMLIWAAATFEARRNQMSALAQYWVTELESWE